mmetsp:Transcript_61300/g.161086  ORF Transcript_61300/g.161086 Transcript_61300/m.161086 type:complete len:296 (-) Transcript_61300:132-1019(-)
MRDQLIVLKRFALKLQVLLFSVDVQLALEHGLHQCYGVSGLYLHGVSLAVGLDLQVQLILRTPSSLLGGGDDGDDIPALDLHVLDLHIRLRPLQAPLQVEQILLALFHVALDRCFEVADAGHNALRLRSVGLRTPRELLYRLQTLVSGRLQLLGGADHRFVHLRREHLRHDHALDQRHNLALQVLNLVRVADEAGLFIRRRHGGLHTGEPLLQFPVVVLHAANSHEVVVLPAVPHLNHAILLPLVELVEGTLQIYVILDEPVGVVQVVLFFRQFELPLDHDLGVVELPDNSQQFG